MGPFLVAVASLLNDGSADGSCKRLRIGELTGFVRAAEGSTERDSHGLASLGSYWDGVCKEDRFNADELTVRAIAKLLRTPRTRWIVTSMLFRTSDRPGLRLIERLRMRTGEMVTICDVLIPTR